MNMENFTKEQLIEAEKCPLIPPPPRGYQQDLATEYGCDDNTVSRALTGDLDKRSYSKLAEKIRTAYKIKFVLPYIKHLLK